MRLSAPRFVVFMLTLAGVVTAVGIHYFGLAVPNVQFVTQHAFELLLASYALLAAGTLLRGL
ncbi:MAG: hypothetical protein AAGF32_06310 [Pseudomonadota bacterium]